jgi:pimeloyl-ACP methyl ester carboxylesterase
MATASFRRFASVVGALLGAALAAGVLWQAQSVRREASEFPPPGRLVDLGNGRRIHLICIGEGAPTVIFEPSGLGGALSSRMAREEISAHARVCSYDRMGQGWSDPGPSVISAAMLADDLERLLQSAALQPPYLLVPASIGGLTVELYARRHRDRVAGIVLLDAATSDAMEHFAPRLNWAVREGMCLTPLAARMGVLRFFDPFGLRGQGADAARGISRMYRVETFDTLCGIARGFSQTLEEFRAAPPLSPDLPLTVLVAETTRQLAPPVVKSLLPDFDVLALERRGLAETFARRSPKWTFALVPGSDHLIASSQPHAVATAIIEMMRKIQTSPRSAGTAPGKMRASRAESSEYMRLNSPLSSPRYSVSTGQSRF